VMDRYNNSRSMRMVALAAKNKNLANKITIFKESHRKPARKSEENNLDFEFPSSQNKSSSSEFEEKDVIKLSVKVLQNIIVDSANAVVSEKNCNDYVTDEDSGDEDYVEGNNLPGSHLRAPTEKSHETDEPISKPGEEDEEENFPLWHFLKLRNLKGTDTVRKNRIPGSILSLVNEHRKKNRGSYEYMYENTHNILVCRWNDNNLVTFATNATPVMPISQAKRFSQKEKKYILVDQPNIVKSYNQIMDGVDRADQRISLYRISIREKKMCYGTGEVSCKFAIHKFQQKLPNIHVNVNTLRNLVEKFQRAGIAYMISRKEKENT
ncbi:hypothetical protein ILUMI_03936, partial [Ignelater luminosus]